MDVSKEINGLIIPQFPGIDAPSIDFDDVLSGKRSRLWYYDLDLTNARSIAANTQTLLQLAGNSFFIDQYSSAGFATVYFQDTNLTVKGAPVYVGPGFIAHQPFTQLLFENVAQPGKTLRILYGIDIDFSPGLSANVTVSNTIGVQGPRSLANGPVLADLPLLSRDVGYVAGANYTSNALLNGAGVISTVFTPAANINGAIIHAAQGLTISAAANQLTMLAKSSAPVNGFDGLLLWYAAVLANNYSANPRMERARFLAAGLGLYWFSLQLETSAGRFVDYTLL